MKVLHPGPHAGNLLDEWACFYQDHCTAVDARIFRMPDMASATHTVPIVVAQTISTNDAYELCRRMFRCEKVYSDFDFVDHRDNLIDSVGSYVVWVMDSIECDEALQGLPATEVWCRAVPSITLRERLLLECFWHWRSRTHLDIRRNTLCAGTRCADGTIPITAWRYARCGKGSFSIGWQHLEGCSPLVGARSVLV